MRSMASAPPIGSTGLSFLSGKRAPKAVAMPMPPSLVALPPMPITKWVGSTPPRWFSRAEGGVGEHGVRADPWAAALGRWRSPFSAASAARQNVAGTRIAARAGDGDGARLAVQGVEQHRPSPSPPSATGTRDLSVRTGPHDARAPWPPPPGWRSGQPLRALGASTIFMGDKSLGVVAEVKNKVISIFTYHANGPDQDIPFGQLGMPFQSPSHCLHGLFG